MNGQDSVVTRIEVATQRLEDLKDRVLQLEFEAKASVERRSEFKKFMELMDLRLQKIEQQMVAAKAGWKTLIGVGSLIGFACTLVVEFVSGRLLR